MTDNITIRGVVGTDIDMGLTNAGFPAANFRLASSDRRRDAETQQWVEVSTNWYTVKAYRGLAQNMASSLRKGDHVVVTGKLQLREWTGEDGRTRTRPEILADGIGPDLKWGTARYVRNSESRAAAEPAGAGTDGLAAASVDTVTGEVFGWTGGAEEGAADDLPDPAGAGFDDAGPDEDAAAAGEEAEGIRMAG